MALRAPVQAPHIPTVSWEEYEQRFVWKQGEHGLLIGPTGVGKSTVAREALKDRDYVVVFVTKSRDATLDSFKKDGYEIWKDWPPPVDMQRVLLWPVTSPKDPAQDQMIKRRVFSKALDHIYQRGGWSPYFDEFRYITESLKLGLRCKELLMQGRSMHVTILASIQRPAWVPLEAYSEVKHLWVWNNPDEANQKRLGELSSVQNLQEIAQGLDFHEFVYRNSRTREAMISQVPEGLARPKKGGK